MPPTDDARLMSRIAGEKRIDCIAAGQRAFSGRASVVVRSWPISFFHGMRKIVRRS